MKDLEMILYKDVIEKEYKNIKFIEKMMGKFSHKNLSRNTVVQLMNNNLTIKELNKIELIAFTIYSCDLLKLKQLKPEDYFSDMELIEFDNYINVNIPKTQIVLDRVIKDPNKHREFNANFISLYDAVSFIDDRLVRYNFDTQREATFRELGNGMVVKEATLNQESVTEIAEEMYNETFPSSTITFNILISEGKKIDMQYDDKKMKLIITPNLDWKSENTTVVDVIDGWHRLSGARKAIEKAKENGRVLNGSLTIKIVILTKEEAIEYIKREQKANPFTTSYLKTLDKNNYEDIIQQLKVTNDKVTNVFCDNIVKTETERLAYNKLTTELLIEKCFKMLNFPTDVISATSMLPRIINTSRQLRDFLSNNDFKYINNPAMSVIYLCVAELIKDLDKSKQIIALTRIGNYILNVEPKELYLTSRTDIKEQVIYNNLKKILMEVE